MLQLAAVGAYDVAVLLSGDDDFVPAVQAVGALGKQVYLATWPGQAVARELRASSFGVIDLAEGVAEFSTGRRRPTSSTSSAPTPSVPSTPSTPDASRAVDPSGLLTPAGHSLLFEIREAQKRYAYVSRWYFTRKWRETGLHPDPIARESMIDELVGGGWVEGFGGTDDKGRHVLAVRVASAGSGESAPV